MALIDRQAMSVLTVDSETDWTFDKVGRCGGIRDLDAPNYEIGNLIDSNVSKRGVSPTPRQHSAAPNTATRLRKCRGFCDPHRRRCSWRCVALE